MASGTSVDVVCSLLCVYGRWVRNSASDEKGTHFCCNNSDYLIIDERFVCKNDIMIHMIMLVLV